MTLPRAMISAIDRWAKQESQKRLGSRVSRSQAVAELCQYALEVRGRPSSAGDRTVRIYRLGEEPSQDSGSGALSLPEKVALTSELSLAAYQMRGENVDRGIRRDVVHLERRKS